MRQAREGEWRAKYASLDSSLARARRSHRDFELRVRPAALKTAASVARPVVGDDAEDVIAGLAERRRGGRLAGECGGRRRAEIGLFDHRRLVGEYDFARPAELAPAHC